MFTRNRMTWRSGLQTLCCALLALSASTGRAGQNYQVFVSNEKSGDITVINGGDNRVLGTIPVGKRPRGIHASPDGKLPHTA